MKTTSTGTAAITFKSDRAAKLALTKAETAYVAARSAVASARHAYWTPADERPTAETGACPRRAGG